MAAKQNTTNNPLPRVDAKQSAGAAPNTGAAGNSAAAAGPTARGESSPEPEPPGAARANSGNAAGPKPSPDKSDTAPQFASLVSKVMELADAGVGLGINVVSLLANFAKNQAGGAMPMPPQSGPPMPQSQAPPQSNQRAPGASGESSPTRNYCIVNRLPLHAGSPVKVSFSINNDMTDTVKELTLSCHGFLEASEGFAIPEDAFSIEPASSSIGPMDFERFVLNGVVPANAPADSYNGWIVVAGDEQLRIPAVLMVN